jgi:predicted Zn-dependent peptidase
MSRPLMAVLLIALGHALLATTPAAAQERYVVLSEPGTPVVTTEILIAVGPLQETTPEAGLAYLAARSVIAPLRTVLDSLGAVVSINAQKDALSFSVTAAPEIWEESSRRLMLALFREPADSLAMLRERREIAAELRGRAANPADAATRELDRAFFGAEHPWGRPTVGTPATVERLSFARVNAFLRDNFTPDRAYAAVVGPVEAPEALSHLRTLLGSTFPGPIEFIPPQQSRLPVRRDYNSITTWVAASYRFPETGDEEALRFLAFLAADDLSFSPTQRSIYNVWAEVFPRTGAGELRVQIVVPPQEVDDWADRVRQAIDRLASGLLEADEFEALLRRYTGERLNRLFSPEARAHAAVRQLLITGRPSPLAPNLGDMTRERVRAAARSLGSPTLVLLGPTVGDE